MDSELVAAGLALTRTQRSPYAQFSAALIERRAAVGDPSRMLEGSGKGVRILLLVLGSHQITRDGLGVLVRNCPDCGELTLADDLGQAAALAVQVEPEIILVAFGFPLQEVCAVRHLRAAAPNARILVMCSFLENPVLAQMLGSELRREGACGLVPPGLDPKQLHEVLRASLSGLKMLEAWPVPAAAPDPPDIRHIRSVPTPQLNGTTLTHRQAQVLQLVAEGLLNKEIAGRLGISIKTVEKHRQSVKERLRAGNTADLTRQAIRMGLA